MDIKALQLICDELNKPKLRKVIDWKKNSRDWSFSVLDTKTSGLGFLFDSYSGGIDVELTSIKQGPKELRNECELAIGTFRIGYLNVQLINARVNSGRNDTEAKLQELLANEDVTLVLGEVPPAINLGNYCFKWIVSFLIGFFFQIVCIACCKYLPQ